MTEFVVTYESTDKMTMIEDRGGVRWTDAPVPPERHECWTQTRGWVGLQQTFRCACGAIRQPFDPDWFEKNARLYAARRMIEEGAPATPAPAPKKRWWRR